MALSFNWKTIDQRPIAGSFWTHSQYYFLSEGLSNSWTFVFLDWSSPHGDYPIYTNRSISTTWSCQRWAVISGGNGTTDDLIVQHDSNGGNFNVTVPTVAGVDQTTFFTNTNATCGAGCSIVEAFEASAQQSWYYNCNITVGSVINGTLPEHQVGESLRTMAAAGIALQGFRLNSSFPDEKQYQVYPAQSAYGEPQGGSSDGIGQLISQFVRFFIDNIYFKVSSY
jgi:hypothetical protein